MLLFVPLADYFYQDQVCLASFSYTVNQESWLADISFKSRLEIRDIDYENTFSDTPLEYWYSSGKFKETRWEKQNLGNALRLALLWKYGGTYMDMDIISLNPLPNIRMVGREDGTRANNAMLSLSRHDPFVWSIMTIFAENFDGWHWAQNGPLAVTRALVRDCIPDVARLPDRLRQPHCNSLAVGRPSRFYPYVSRPRRLIAFSS